MNDLSETSKVIRHNEQALPKTEQGSLLKRLRGGGLLILGYFLSPLSWWNDLFFNLPLAYGFGYLISLFSPQLFLPGAIAGYWLSNVAGILMMQLGFVDVVQGEAKERNFKKELLTGFVSSTIYTLVILVLVHYHILQTPELTFTEGGLNWRSLLPINLGS
jgi:hypothetical protein